jgi:hypothetical protein
MSPRVPRILSAVLLGAISSAIILLLGGHFHALGVAAALVIGGGVALSLLLQPRQACRRR